MVSILISSLMFAHLTFHRSRLGPRCSQKVTMRSGQEDGLGIRLPSPRSDLDPSFTQQLDLDHLLNFSMPQLPRL